MYIISLLCRYLLCLIPYMILVSNKSIIYHITGPITIPPFNESKGPLIYWIASIQLFRIFYTPIIHLILTLLPTNSKSLEHYTFRNQPQSLLLTNMCIKYGIVLVMKLFIVFYEIHRMKYYLHVLFLELGIMAVNVLADVVGNQKVALVMDIVLVDALNRVAIFYELTRTFNPNFGLYFFGNNLLTLICYMLEGNRKQVLYVRHDIYRIMIITMSYLFLFSLFQSSITYRPLIIFLLTSYFFYQTIHQFSHQPLILQPKPQPDKKSRPYSYRFRKYDQSFNEVNGKKGHMVKWDDVKEYVNEVRKKKALLMFLVVVGVTVVVEVAFVWGGKQAEGGDEASQGELVKNTFMEFYEAMQNQSSHNNSITNSTFEVN